MPSYLVSNDYGITREKIPVVSHDRFFALVSSIWKTKVRFSWYSQILSAYSSPLCYFLDWNV